MKKEQSQQKTGKGGDDRPIVDLPPGRVPYVDPNVDPASLSGAAAYAAGIAGRRSSSSLPKGEFGLHQKRPPIPILTGHPEPGDGPRTMAEYGQAEQAARVRAERAQQASPAPARAGGPSIIAEGPRAPAQAAPTQPGPTAASLGLGPLDTLPPAAQKDPAFRQGPGAHMAVNQPALAAKYGVNRNGTFVPPQQLGGQQRGLSPKSVEDLETIARLQQAQSEGRVAGLDDSEEESRRAVEDGIGGAAGRAANLPGDNSTGPTSQKEVDEKLKKAINQMDAFEFNEWRQLMMRELLNSEEQRKIIEDRLEPLDLGEVVMTGLVSQTVPIVPGKYEIEVRSFDGQMDLALKRLVMSESRSTEVTEQYLLDKYTFMSTALGLVRVNNKRFPDVVDDKGNFSDELFYQKFNMVMKLPVHMLSSIGVNVMWFEMRVRRLFRAQEVGNG